MDNLKKKINKKSIQVSITASILYIILAHPFIFKNADKLLSMLIGTKLGTNYIIVLFFHAIVFGILMFLSSKYFFNDFYNWVQKKI